MGKIENVKMKLYNFSEVVCDKPSVAIGTVSPDTATIASGTTYEVSCNSGLKISLTCGSDGELNQTPTCLG